jgi:hypothetical protein
MVTRVCGRESLLVLLDFVDGKKNSQSVMTRIMGIAFCRLANTNADEGYRLHIYGRLHGRPTMLSLGRLIRNAFRLRSVGWFKHWHQTACFGQTCKDRIVWKG